ncbi:MAG: acetyl-CoA carboxylase biotin carboxyl carrier protein subunit [Burkholderiales bacterium]
MAVLKLRCEVAGRVVRIEAQPGAAVQAEDAILIVESMKMEIPLFAPAAGIVEAILVAEGDEIAEDQEAVVLLIR